MSRWWWGEVKPVEGGGQQVQGSCKGGEGAGVFPGTPGCTVGWGPGRRGAGELVGRSGNTEKHCQGEQSRQALKPIARWGQGQEGFGNGCWGLPWATCLHGGREGGQSGWLVSGLGRCKFSGCL